MREAPAPDAYRLAGANLVIARSLVAKRTEVARAQAFAKEARDGFTKLGDREGEEQASALLAQLP